MSDNVQSERSVPLWASLPESLGQPLDDSRPADLVIIGAGMAGLSVAYEALLQGRQVTILDRGSVASGMTARTTAHLASALDDRYYKFIALRGEEEARQLYESLVSAIDRIEQIVREEKIDCDFQRVDGYLVLGEGDDPGILEREIEACHQIGFDAVSWSDTSAFPTFDSGPCLRFPNQARFHPLKYLAGLVEAIKVRGGMFHPFTIVQEVKQDGSTVAVKLRGGNVILAQDVVCATNSPIAGRLTLQAKMAPYRSYAMSFSIPRGSMPDTLTWDTLDAYHYVRLQPGEMCDYLIVGGEDHKTGEADDAPERFQRLHTWALIRYGLLEEVTHRWSGQVLEPVDFAGYVGRDPDNDHIYFVTGDSGQGITNGALAGLLIPSLFENGFHPWQKLYDPARITLKSADTFVSENATAVKSLAEHLGGALLPSEGSLMRCQGGLVRDGVNVVAAFRDEDDVMHRVSSKCSHVWCTVHFNTFERCWDCPCHGSHFDIDGNELNAPATAPLAPIKLPSK